MIRAAAFLATAWIATGAIAGSDLGSAGAFRSIRATSCNVVSAANGPQDRDDIAAGALSGRALAEAHVLRARRMIGCAQVPKIEGEIAAAMAADPTGVDLLHFKGRFLLFIADYAKAAEILEAALRLAPQDPHVTASLAAALMRSNNQQRASELIGHAIALKPDDGDILLVDAMISRARGDLPSAAARLDRLLVLDPTHLDAKSTRMHIRIEMGDYDNAARDADDLMSAEPERPFFRSIRAGIRVARGDVDGSLEDLTELIGPPGGPYRTGPSDLDLGQLTFRRLNLLVRAKRRAEALRDIEYMLSTGGRPSVLRFQLHLRRNGVPDAPLDGLRSPQLEDAVTCFVSEDCGRASSKT